MRLSVTQITSIIRILCLDIKDAGKKLFYIKINLRNHLVEIKTGEGKSITLRLTFIILAWMGYGVDFVSLKWISIMERL